MSVKIVFFGSGPVAAAALRLLARHTDIEAVITKPQPEHHREEFPVLAACRELAIGNILTCAGKQQLQQIFDDLPPFAARLGVVIDFGIIIPRPVIDAFELGIVNSHFSLLPRLRGADPISFAILSGQKQTGVSLMLINEQMDEGPLLAQAVYDLPADITTPRLTEDLIELSDQTLKSILPLYLAGQIQPAPQEQATMAETKEPSYSRKLSKKDGVIDWHKPAVDIEREVRAYAGWPKSQTDIGGRDVVITAAHVIDGDGTPGVIYLEGKQIGMHTSEGILVIDRLKPSGKQEMTGSDFLLGYSTAT